MKITTLKRNGLAALVVGERLVEIAPALQRHGLLASPPPLTLLDLLADWERNLALLVSLQERLEIDEPGETFVETLLDAPIRRPGKMLFAAANYHKHVRQFERVEGEAHTNVRRAGVIQTHPYLFLKLPESVIGPTDSIMLPAEFERVDWELELGVIIGREGRHIQAEQAMEYVAGFVVINDITARDYNVREDWPTLRTDWFIAKSFDTFCPVGPFFVPKEFVANYRDLTARLWLNGQLYQEFSPADMVYSVEEQMEWASRVTTLRPGDVLATGSGPGNGLATGRWLRPGDVLEAEITGLGRQKTPVFAERPVEGKHL